MPKIEMMHDVLVMYEGLKAPSLYIAVSHGAYPRVCDSCHLQGHCDELFQGGDNCRIISKDKRWYEVTPEQLEAIKGFVRYSNE